MGLQLTAVFDLFTSDIRTLTARRTTNTTLSDKERFEGTLVQTSIHYRLDYCKSRSG